MSLLSISFGSAASGQQAQLQRAADQASQAAQSLQAQARDARATADRTQSEARALEMKAGQAQAAANQASLSVQTTASFTGAQASLGDVYTVLPKMISLNNQRPPVTQTTTLTPVSTTPTVGTRIDTTA